MHEPVPTRNHSEIMLRHFGAEVTVSAERDELIEIVGQPDLRGADIAIPGDPSSAAFPIVACLLVPGSRVVIRAVGLNP
ncbi:hypothetical protein WB472_47935, partial [Streptomyces brasiliscabiei]